MPLQRLREVRHRVFRHLIEPQTRVRVRAERRHSFRQMRAVLCCSSRPRARALAFAYYELFTHTVYFATMHFFPSIHAKIYRSGIFRHV